MEKKKNILIGALLVAIVLMSVGYAALAQLLTINGTANISADWNVRITNISEKTAVGATTKTLEPVSTNSTTATFEVDLAYPGAYAEYDVTIANNGSIDAVLESISSLEATNAAAPTEIVYSISGISVNDKLAAKNGQTVDTHVATVRVEWVAKADNTDAIPTTTTKTATINLNYKQDTATE